MFDFIEESAADILESQAEAATEIQGIDYEFSISELDAEGQSELQSSLEYEY